MLFCIATAFAQNITKAEYFFDIDQGIGNGTSISNFSPADVINLNANIAINTLAPGFHVLLMRVLNSDGVWSLTDSRYFYISSNTTVNTANITAAEYFIDADPGAGNALSTPVGITGAVVNFTAMIPANLSPGFHRLLIRTKDADGKWGLSETRTFYIYPPTGTNMPIITAAEYFFDHDPGVGSGTLLSFVTPGDEILQPFMIPVPAGMSAGDHFLTIRAKDQAGNWSLFEKDTLTIGAASNSVSCPANVTIDAAGQCSAVVNNIDPVITPAGSDYIYTLSGATTGSGTGTASGKTFNAGVTTVTYALFNSPSTDCSFTVTVNSGITPTIYINASGTEICPGQQVVFTTIQFNGGATPSYQWKLNGTNIPGATSATYQSTSLTDGDIVSVLMTSSLGCASPQTALSNTILINVSSSVAPLVNLGVSATKICTGTPVNFIAIPTNGGISPTYQWKLNGNIIPGVTGSTYQSSTLANGDHVTVTMTSSLACANPQTATITGFTMTVTPTLPPSVYLESSYTTICAGTTATFYANPTNGGTDPSYQWKINGNNVGSDSDVYSSSSLHNGDIVSVAMTSSLGCASPQSALSSSTTMTVLPSSPASVNINASSTTICAGTTVTFKISQVTAGASYQWQLNGNNIPGAPDTTYQSSSLQNGDKIKVIMTQYSPCFPTSSVASNEITISVNAAVTPSVIIGASATTICPGQLVTFTATPTNGGNNPNYGWTLNGNDVGSNSNTYQSSTLHNGDVIKVGIGSSLSCASPITVYSNTIAMTVGSGVTPSVSINASAIDICAGQQVTFTATPTNGGSDPIYQWKLNGNNVGSNSSTYQTTSLANTDTIKIVMTSSLSCATFPIATSNYISMDVSTSVLPSVSITADLTYICQGELVKFTATPTNGGNPTYQWKLNGNNVGTNNNIYQSTSFGNNDSIEVVMTSSLGCAVPQSVTSNNVFMTVTTAVTPQVSIESSSSYVCTETLVTFTATPVNGGTPSYQWKLNGNNVGTDYYKYENSGLSAGDIISVSMTTTLGCVTTSTAVSNSITMEASSSSITYYRDLDGDGYGNSSSGTIQACGKSAGYVSNNSDCNDNNAAIFPGASEVCGNGIDDDCNGQTDENCAEGLPVLTVKTYPVKEGDVGYTTVDIEVKLDRPAVSAVRLNYATDNDDAIVGSDYVAANGVLIIPSGSSSATIQVKVIGDLLKESNERFRVNFTDPVNVVLPDDSYSRIMIIDDDKGKTPRTIVNNDQSPVREEIFKIPTVTKRNQVWVIPQIGNYENEVLIVNVQGQVVNKFANYKNQTPIGNVSTGIYFYRIRIMESPGQYKYYSGRLLITE